MQIEYSKKAVKYINALDKPAKQRIKVGIEGLIQKLRRYKALQMEENGLELENIESFIIICLMGK